MRLTLMIGTLLAVLAMGAAGCGGSSKGTSTADFTKRGNAVCTRAVQHLRTDTSGTLEARFVALQKTKITGLGALTPPDGLGHVYAQYKTLLTHRLDVVQRAFTATREHSGRLHVLREMVYQERVAETTLATALGLKACDEISY